jgi:hypothetical protein
MTYASSTKLGYLIASIADSVSANLKAQAITTADAWVNSQIGTVSGTVPLLIEEAATHFAYAFLLRILYDTDSEESQTMVWYEKLARELLAAYQAQNPDTPDYESPYSSNLTPTESYMKRNVRSEDDPDEWDSE